ncbi:MAG TPA: Gfo/Idh/MocA family oxidoreductase [Bryobacteraceae bacterium]|jgi:predicted dehydrogenase|nr:Gfo/Idh/MocA family oxidoreductase [Bryobacteraceae bacterium]
MSAVRAIVVGAGVFGRNHARAITALPDVQLSAIVDTDFSRAQALAQEFDSHAFSSVDQIIGRAEAAIVATPTSTHEMVAGQLLEAGMDVLVEKPIADTSEAGERLAQLAERHGRILQVGHLERFNPAVMALEQVLTIPLFFEVHRLSVFTPRSLDVDVVLDLMIHDLDIVLNFTQEMPEEIRAAGISVLSQRVDIANVRLAFPSGCIANLTASRVSTEKVRKLRVFQPRQYISLDYQRQDAVSVAVKSGNAMLPGIGFEQLPVERGEPLALELRSFFACVRDRTTPRVTAGQASNALRVAEAILAKIREHGELVAETVRRRGTFPR